MNKDMALPQDFAGRVALVTGSTQGLGAEIAALLVRRGLAGLVVTGRDQARGEAAAARFAAAGCETIFVRADLESHDDVVALIAACERKFGTPPPDGDLEPLVKARGRVDEKRPRRGASTATGPR